MCDQANHGNCEIVYDLQLENGLLATQITELKKEIVFDIQVYLMNSMTNDDMISHQYWDGRRKKWEAK